MTVTSVVIAALISCSDADAPQSHAQVRVIESGAVYVGGPAPFSALAGLDSLRLATVLDLDREHVGAPNGRVARDWEIARERGLRFVHLPLHPVLPPSLAELEAAVAILSDTWARPVLVRVDRGPARATMVVAAYRVARQGWSAERAFAEMTAGGAQRAELEAWRRRLDEYAAARRSRDPLDQSPVRPMAPSVVAAITDRR